MTRYAINSVHRDAHADHALPDSSLKKEEETLSKVSARIEKISALHLGVEEGSDFDFQFRATTDLFTLTTSSSGKQLHSYELRKTASGDWDVTKDGKAVKTVAASSSAEKDILYVIRSINHLMKGHFPDDGSSSGDQQSDLAEDDRLSLHEHLNDGVQDPENPLSFDDPENPDKPIPVQPRGEPKPKEPAGEPKPLVEPIKVDAPLPSKWDSRRANDTVSRFRKQIEELRANVRREHPVHLSPAAQGALLVNSDISKTTFEKEEISRGLFAPVFDFFVSKPEEPPRVQLIAKPSKDSDNAFFEALEASSIPIGVDSETLGRELASRTTSRLKHHEPSATLHRFQGSLKAADLPANPTFQALETYSELVTEPSPPFKLNDDTVNDNLETLLKDFETLSSEIEKAQGAEAQSEALFKNSSNLLARIRGAEQHIIERGTDNDECSTLLKELQDLETALKDLINTLV